MHVEDGVVFRGAQLFPRRLDQNAIYVRISLERLRADLTGKKVHFPVRTRRTRGRRGQNYITEVM